MNQLTCCILVSKYPIPLCNKPSTFSHFQSNISQTKSSGGFEGGSGESAVSKSAPCFPPLFTSTVAAAADAGSAFLSVSPLLFPSVGFAPSAAAHEHLVHTERSLETWPTTMIAHIEVDIFSNSKQLCFSKHLRDLRSPLNSVHSVVTPS